MAPRIPGRAQDFGRIRRLSRQDVAGARNEDGPRAVRPQAYPAHPGAKQLQPCPLPPRGELPFSTPAPSQVLSAPSSLCLWFEPCQVTPRNVPTALSALTPDASQQSPRRDSTHRTRTHKLTSHGTFCRPAAPWTPPPGGLLASRTQPGRNALGHHSVPSSQGLPPQKRYHHHQIATMKTKQESSCTVFSLTQLPVLVLNPAAAHHRPLPPGLGPLPPTWAGASRLPVSTLTPTILLFTQQPRGPFKCTFYQGSPGQSLQWLPVTLRVNSRH